MDSNGQEFVAERFGMATLKDYDYNTLSKLKEKYAKKFKRKYNAEFNISNRTILEFNKNKSPKNASQVWIVRYVNTNTNTTEQAELMTRGEYDRLCEGRGN